MAGCVFLLERPPAACLCGSACKWSGDCLRSMLPWQLTKGQHLPTADAPSAGRLREMERATSLSRSIPHLWTGANIAIAPPNRTLVCRSSQLYIRGNSIELAWFAPKLHIHTCIADGECFFTLAFQSTHYLSSAHRHNWNSWHTFLTYWCLLIWA